MKENIKKGFGLMLGAILASALMQGISELAGISKSEESNEKPESEEEA